MKLKNKVCWRLKDHLWAGFWDSYLLWISQTLSDHKNLPFDKYFHWPPSNLFGLLRKKKKKHLPSGPGPDLYPDVSNAPGRFTDVQALQTNLPPKLTGCSWKQPVSLRPSRRHKEPVVGGTSSASRCRVLLWRFIVEEKDLKFCGFSLPSK